ncbi:hypothetical protein B0H63DRAFT_527826 [Podospora didyma]|uniref:CFEM domain-containing protein n=1 Tax=Podospora didyma TaxID=330526 RepID=A0AAE0K4S2_9PEZI|nr:hypothetical protein B0H63DRAFT_527826 [Podospora didyma]
MKYSAVFLGALVAAVSAQSGLESFPECSQKCISTGVTTVGCTLNDVKCICEKMETLVAGATSCVVAACGIDVAIGKVLPASSVYCEAGAAPVASASSSSSAAAAVTTAAQATPSSTAAASTSAAAEATSSSTVVVVVSSAAPIASSSSAAGGFSNGTTTTHFSSQPSSTSSTKAPTSTAGAAVLGAAGSLGMLVLGALAAL